MQQCPFCEAENFPLTQCKLGHIYCDDCALVSIKGGEEHAEDLFCPLCTPPPQEFVCPITHELMISPVVAQDGFTYEKAAIEDWMKQKKTSPKTNEPIEAVFVPNFNLRSLITEWKQRYCGSAQSK